MARTIIGQLILRMKQEGAQETQRSVAQAMAGIESAVGRVGSAKWGSKFDAQLNQLKVTPAEREAIVASYDRLMSSIQGRMSGGQKTAWRGGVLAYLASVRGDMETTEKRAVTMMDRLKSTFSTIGSVAVGYGLYTGARGGVNAAFEQQRQEATGYFSGLPDEDRAALKTAAEELSAKYGLAMADMLQALQEAALNMPSTEDAIKSGDAIARLLTSLEAVYGPDGAVSGTYEIMKGIDNVAMNQSPEEVYKALDGFMRAQQVLGKDFSPAAFKAMLQYARTAGKALDDDFLLTWLPLLASETTGSDAGTRLRANFDQLIVGRASDKAEAAQTKYGIRDGENGLIGRDVYEQNPVLWANNVLLPALQKAGVNTENPVELAQVLGEITNNRLSSDFLAASLISFTQYLRQATERIPAAKGLDAADEVRQRDPFAAVQGMVNSLSNLSGALGEHVVPVIIPAMNSFASAIETVATAVRGSSDLQVGLAGIATVVGGFAAFKVGSALFGGIGALATAGPSLQTAAGMLQAAATRLGAGPGGVVPPVGPTPPPGGGFNPTFALLAPWIADQIRNATLGPMTPEDHEIIDGASGRVLGRIFDFFENFTPATAPDPGPYAGMANSPMTTGIFPEGQEAPWGGGVAQAKQAGAEMKTALSPEGKPTVDLSAVEHAISRVQVLLNMLAGVGAASSQAGSRLKSQIEASYSDYGVTP